MASNSLRLLRRFSKDNSGQFFILTAILLPLLILVCAILTDYLNILNQRYKVQDAADRAVIATTAALASDKIQISKAQAYAKEQFELRLKLLKQQYDAVFFQPPTVAKPRSC